MKRSKSQSVALALAAGAMLSLSVLHGEERVQAPVTKEAYQAAIEGFGVDASTAAKAAEKSVETVAASNSGKTQATEADPFAKVVADLQK